MIEICPVQNSCQSIEIKFKIYKQVFTSTIAQMRNFGYNAESHIVRTSDGYILTMQRILPTVPNSLPVLLLPGGSCAPMTFFEHQNALGFEVADKGYDLWIGNFRGNLYYSRHVNHSKFSQKFWDFSWDDQGYYDIPAMIDHILETTNYKKLVVISYSLASGSVFALESTIHEYNKVVGHIALAPVIALRYINSMVVRFGHSQLKLKIFTGSLAVPNIILLSSLLLLKVLGTMFCLVVPSLCDLSVHITTGYKPYFQPGESALLIGHLTDGLSGKALQHLVQKKPPAFNLSQITTPTIIFSGANDPLANPLDIEIITRQIKSAQKEVISNPSFNHAEYVTAPPAPYFNETVQKILQHVDNFAKMISQPKQQSTY
uniref:Partial AB-hydrolase lipase domain-containing protein n=1 Tax=Strigamia maritima TaxID=126957 RepID=T1J4D9_STRMM